MVEGTAGQAAQDWPRVVRTVPGFLLRSKDLALSVLLCRALTKLDGVSGAAVGLQCLSGLTQRYWDRMHPRLDPDDDNDPTLRLNLLEELAGPQGLAGMIETHVVLRDPYVGPVTLRALMRSLTHSHQEGDPTPEHARALLSPDLQTRLTGAAGAAAGYLNQLRHSLMDKVGDSAPVFAPLPTLFREIAAVFGQQADADNGGAVVGTPAAAGPAAAAFSRPAAVRSPSAAGISGNADVVRAIDDICAYYRQAEPSSPVPLILQRAKRLVGADFGTILRDLASDGVNQFEKISGIPGPE